MKNIAFVSLLATVATCWTQSVQQIIPELIPIWERLGDAALAVDEDRGTVSIESAEFSPSNTLRLPPELRMMAV